MPSPWMESVRRSKQLTVFPTQAVVQGSWAGVFTAAMAEFNRLSATLNFGVTLVLSATPPDSNGFGGANVNFDVGDGEMHYMVLGNDKSVNVVGDALHGHTQVASWINGKGDKEVIKAFTYVPRNPIVETGPAGQQVKRNAGDGIRLFIAVHELIHTAGLSNPEHSPESIPDIFIGQPQPSPGKTPQDDKLRIRLDPPNNNLFAPPLIVSARTAGLIRSNWP